MAEVFPCLNPRCREGDIPQCAACRTYFQRYRDAITSPADPWPQGWDGRDKEAFQRAIAGVLVGAPVDNWRPIKSAPRDGSNILLAWGRDGVSQGKYIPGLPRAWQFIDTDDGITWLINHAVDNEYGPTHWQPMPSAPGVAPREDQPVAWLYRDHYGKLKLAQTEPPPDGAFPVFVAAGVREVPRG